ncbi:MAG: alpha-amylase [Balneola sp.]|nr:alpha-amylase [Balneola sp.]MBO6650459.1 alpha-amylase [Balneola sp.]MBO6710145.1 alpha-amylase [Balneola sp.]MBO6798829.1 alpha-amylase [Balneola sp.]MBO6869943.1 alpha-amylase [Balneola sp.]
MLKRTLLLSIFVASVFGACTPTEKPVEKKPSQVVHPEWSKNANIYEVNIRQYSEEGTFKAFQEDLPRLKEMGVKILWLMPIHPIGKINRKETEESRGSYYSVADYKKVNPNFGTEEDFRNLVDAAHEQGFKLIIDWVANHSAWDNPWTENKDWYELTEDGNFMPPRGTDWSDVIQLDYTNEEMRAAMLDAMEYWVSEFDIDGYRCDVAGMVPTDFWENARVELDKIKPVFMLAEDGEPELLHKAFDMNYAWEYAHVIREIAKGEQTFEDLDALFERDDKRFPDNAYRMYFTSNHDENSWNGTDPEMYGDNFENFAVLSATVKGMPLIYNGQESDLDKRLEFFEKDEIEWKDYKYADLYKMLLTLNTENEALWNGDFGGKTIRVESPKGTYAFKRKKGDHEIWVAINNNSESVMINFPDWSHETFSVYGAIEEVTDITTIELPANEWFIISTLKQQ